MVTAVHPTGNFLAIMAILVPQAVGILRWAWKSDRTLTTLATAVQSLADTGADYDRRIDHQGAEIAEIHTDLALMKAQLARRKHIW